MAVLLTAVSGRYDYARDELYFRMLEPAWGYVDQPPLVPLLAGVLGGHPALLRVPATVAAVASVAVAALLVRELGGQPRAQAWTGWAYAGTSACLNFGHVLLTSAFDLLFWPLVCLLVVRAELRERPRLWLLAGLVAGLATYNKLLIGLLLVGIALGLAVTVPRRLASPYVVGGGAIAAAVALPNLIYQATHDWPQLAMGRALAENNAGEVRWFMWVLLVVVLGPPLVLVWGAGLLALWRREDWRPVRFLVPAFVLVVAFTFATGAQPHYPTFLLPVVLAAGAADLGHRLDHVGWRWAVAINAAVAIVVSLPVLPAGVLGRTPVPAMNLLAADQIGWPAYAAQVRAVHASVPDGERVVVVTSNYGEAGAVDRYASDLPVFSGQNALYDQARPPDDATTVVFVGEQLAAVRGLFSSCEVVDELDNGLDVDNEEQGVPVAVCRGPVASWSALWPEFRHLD